uniref:Uncharacterized protein n=1 Tax=Salix viminalis TaxID=40686 RepID=A0A6N2KWQ6_SALVM
MAGGKSKIGSIRSVFMHADSLDCFLMVLGSLALNFFVSSKLMNNLLIRISDTAQMSSSFPFFSHFQTHKHSTNIRL